MTTETSNAILAAKALLFQLADPRYRRPLPPSALEALNVLLAAIYTAGDVLTTNRLFADAVNVGLDACGIVYPTAQVPAGDRMHGPDCECPHPDGE